MGTINHIFTSPKADDADATLVRPSDWNSAHAYTMQDAISAGTQVASSGTVIFADSNGVTWGLSGSSQITATVSTNYVTGSGNTSKYGHAWELTGNTAGTTSSLQGSKWYFEGGNSMTVSGNSNTIKFSVGNYLTTARGSTDAIGLNTAKTNVTWTVNSSGLSFDAGGYAGTTTAATSATLTLDSGGLRVSIGPYITTADLSANSSKYGQAWELTGNTAGTTSSAQGTKWYFDGGNSITVSGNSNTIRFSVGNYLTTARGSTDAIGLNTAKTNVTWTVNSSGLSLDAGGYAGTGTSATNASITMNSNGLAISVAAPGAANISVSNAIQQVSSATGSGTNTSRFAADDHVHAGVYGVGVSNLGNTSGDTRVSFGRFVMSGTGAMTLSQATAANELNTIGFSVPQTSSLVGTSGLSVSTNGSTISVYPQCMSYFVWPPEPVAGTTSLTLGGSSVFVEPFFIAWPVSASFLRIPISIPAFGSTTTGTTAARSWTFNESASYYAIIYSQNVGASSRSLASIYSSSLSSAMNLQYQIGAASNNQTCSHNITYGLTGNSNQNFATNYNVNSGSANISTTHLTAFTGIRYLDIPLGTLLTPGNYWLGLAKSSTTASTSAGGNWANITNCTSNDTYLAISQISSNVNEMGANTSAGSNMWQGRGHGYWTTNTNGATTASMKMNEISSAANHPMIQFILMREN